ncbi:PstS family phosphate ABC transporter substrate-binding protein, partial [Pseudomonas sp. CGJS7]|uniref:PstS family phosphate ABC transporter substrate-binding protein n=1 Tax=Pseudomonas sp. CGJS7 TaxID=3109348 RepID=UPI00300BD47A
MHRNMLTLSRLAIATVAFAAAGSAAAVDLYGGGATFPAPAYVGDLYNSTTPKARLSRSAGMLPSVTAYQAAGLGNSTGTLVPVFSKYASLTSNKVSYCQTGSGMGKNVLNQNGIFANGQCFDNATASKDITGFTSNDPVTDFIGSDSPISTADYNTFNTNMSATRGAIVQIPTLAGAIAIPYNETNVPAGLQPLALTTEQVCKIYGRQFTLWSQVNASLPANAIKIVYRKDGSGTTFAFTSFLTAKCNTAYGTSFSPNQNFAAAMGAQDPADPTLVPGAWGWTAATGNNNVVSTVKTTADAAGYADVAEVVNQSAKYALVDGFNPTTMPASLNILPASIQQGLVLNGAATAAVPGSGTTAQKNCLKLVSSSAPISGAYPIVAVTYINAYYSGNGSTKAPALRDLLKLFYNTTNAPALPTGYSYLSGNALLRTQMSS